MSYTIDVCAYADVTVEPLIDSIMNRIPAMKNAEIRQMVNGPESFTPDLHAIMGEAPEVIVCLTILELNKLRLGYVE